MDFERDGYAFVDDVDLLAGIDADGIWEQLAPAFASGVDRVMDAWTTSPAVRAIATHPDVLATLRSLYGREPIPFQTLNYRNGSQQRTHSDVIHFSSLPSGFMCGVWVALEDVTPAQGPLHYYPRSQVLPELDYEDLDIPVPPPPHDWKNPLTLSSYRAYEDQVEGLLASGGYGRVELEIRRGAYFVWSANLFHGGSPIRDAGRTRKSQVTHYFFADTVPITPMFSQRSRGAYKIRPVRDIRDGAFVVPTIDGERVLFERVAGGLRRIRPVTSTAARLTWNIVKHRPLPDTPTSIVRDKLRAFAPGGTA